MKLDFERTFSNFIGMISLKNERIWIKFIETADFTREPIVRKKVLLTSRCSLKKIVSLTIVRKVRSYRNTDKLPLFEVSVMQSVSQNWK